MIPRFLTQQHRHRWSIVVPLCSIIAAALLVFAQPATVTYADSRPKVEVQAVKNPVTVGELVRYKIKVRNNMDEDLTRVDVKLHFNRDLITPFDSHFNDDDDWVSDIKTGELIVTFGRIDKDKDRSATIDFQLNPNVPANTSLEGSATYKWFTQNNSHSDTADDFDNVLVINPNATPQAAITPDAGPAGTVYQISATSFESNEGITTWLNTPSGVEDRDLAGKADNSGTATLQFNSQGLTPGDYSLVLHGRESGREYVVFFTVQP